MAKKELLFALILLVCLSSNARADSNIKVTEEDKLFAYELAKRSRQMSISAIKEKWQELQEIRQEREVKGNDIDFLESSLANKPILKLFVSISMGETLLKTYVEQARLYDAILVFNGLPDDSWRKLSELVTNISGDSSEAVAMQIDDEAFREYGIKSVPSFVLIEPLDSFAVFSSETAKFDKVAGNIGIERALEIIAKEGELSDFAKRLLSKAAGEI